VFQNLAHIGIRTDQNGIWNHRFRRFRGLLERSSPESRGNRIGVLNRRSQRGEAATTNRGTRANQTVSVARRGRGGTLRKESKSEALRYSATSARKIPRNCTKFDVSSAKARPHPPMAEALWARSQRRFYYRDFCDLLVKFFFPPVFSGEGITLRRASLRLSCEP
jgi:hypothetical protein